ncbi:helix-turn-helix domain-containing protein, partial [Wocania arenilitoris]
MHKKKRRFRVAQYLLKKLGTQKQASEVFGITERSVNKIWAHYKQGG